MDSYIPHAMTQGHLLRRLWFCIVLAASAPLLSAQWIDTNRSGGLAWFFFSSPARAEIYDLVAEEWLPPVSLPVKSEAMTAAYADADGIYLAYGKSLYRYDLSGEGEQFLFSATLPIGMVTTDGSLLFSYSKGTYSDGYTFTSLSKTNNNLIDTYSSSSYQTFGSAQILPEQNQFVGINSSSSRSLPYNASGMFGTTKPSSFPSPYPSKIWYFPGGDISITNNGGLHESFSNRRLRTLPVTPDEVVFRGADIPIVREGRKITAFSNTDRELGEKDIAHAVGKLYVEGDKVFAFGADIETPHGMAVSATPFSELGDPQPGEPKDPFGLSYNPESVFVGNDGVVHLFSRAYQCLFRWDPASQSYLPSINLDGVPWHVSYATSQNRVYLSYRNGRIEKGTLQDGAFNQALFAYAPSQYTYVTIPARSYLIMLQEGSSNILYAYNWKGTQTDQGPWTDSDSIFWDASRQLLFSVSWGYLASVPFRASSRYHPSIGLGEFGVAKSNNSAKPGRILGLTDSNNALISSSGKMFDPVSLDAKSAALGNEITDGLGFAGAVKTIRTISGVAQLQSWDGSTYAPGTVKQLPGEALRLIKAGTNMVAVVRSEQGIPQFYLLNAEFGVVPPAALEQPGGVFAGVVDPATVKVSWIDVSGESEYRIERRETGDSAWAVVGTAGTSITEFEDATVVSGNSYEYRVTAVNGALESPPSEVVLVELRAPGAMADLALTEIGETRVTLGWTPVALATGYQFEYQKATGTTWTSVTDTTNGQSASFSINNLNTSTDYRFRARAGNGIGSGPWTVVEGTTLHTLPATPGNFNVWPSTLSYRVSLTWYSQTGCEFVLERRHPDEAWAVIYTGSKNNFKDTDVQAETRYDYRIKAQNSRGESDYTSVLEVTTPQLEVPGAPRYLWLRPLAGAKIKVSWLLNDPVAETLVLERRTDQGQEWAVIASMDSETVKEYIDADVTPGFQYYYQIKAVNVSGESGYKGGSILAIDGVCLLQDDFEDENLSPWAELEGGERIVDGGQGFPAGGVFWFGGPWERSLTTVPLDVRRGGSITLTLRMGNGEKDGYEFWDDAEQYEGIQVQYAVDGGSWQKISDVNPDDVMDWQTRTFGVPTKARTRSTRFRVIQNQFSGPGFDTWAIDEYCVLVNRPENLPPVFADDVPEFLTANATADPITVNMAEYVSDGNMIDTTYFSIVGVSNPAIFSHFSIDMLTGRLRLEFAPCQVGTSTLTIEVTDESGASARTTMTVALPGLPLPVVVREGAVTFNPRTGLFEHAVTIANNGVRPIAGFQLEVTGLDEGYSLWGFEDGKVSYDTPLAPAEEVTLHLEYHSSTSGSGPRPDFVIHLLYPEGNPNNPSADPGGPALRSTQRDKAKIFEFGAQIGKRYRVQYSKNLSEWIDAGDIVVAGANRVQWLDQGPPKTDCHPAKCPIRYYRAIELDE